MHIDVHHIMEIIKTAGHEVFIVGGAVRDFLLGQEPHDVDLVTNARPDRIIEIFNDPKFREFKVNHVGKSFGVVIINGIEVASYRADVHSGIGDENCAVEFVDTIEEDLSRRDFSINGMAQCLSTGRLIDLFDGREDLKNGLIRFIGSPQRRIEEDPNRILRACRFLAKIEGSFEEDTLRHLQRNVDLVRTHVAPERIRLEIMKAMELDHPSMFFAALELIGALKIVLPEMHRAVDHDHGKWHIENVFEHQMLAGDHISKKDPILRLVGFLHDYGKPQSFIECLEMHPQKHFIHHEVIGEKFLRRDLTLLKFSSEEINRIAALTRSHMYVLQEMTPKAFRRMLKKFSDRKVEWRDFLRLRLADRAGSLSHPRFSLSDNKTWVRQFKNEGKILEQDGGLSIKMLALSGGEIINELGLRPGPLVGEIQRHLLEQVIEEGFEINEREKLLELARSFVTERNQTLENQ